MSDLAEMTVIRIISASVAFIFLVLFVCPFFHKIVNFGNCIGTFLSASAILCIVFYDDLSKSAARLWGTPHGRIFMILAAAVMALALLISAVVSAFMIAAMRNVPNGDDTTLVVLGCKVKSSGPSRMLRRRLDKAASYLAEHESVKVIVSGGKGTNEKISEAECMESYLLEKGIAPERIFSEDSSVNTNENLRFSEKLAKQNGLAADMTIVTDGFHQLRAYLTAKKLGIRAYAVCSPTTWWMLPTYWIREIPAVVFYVLRNAFRRS